MFAIEVDNEFLKLPLKYKIGYKISNPLFSEGNQGEFSYEFTLPASATNKRLLSNAHIIENSENWSYQIDCRLHLFKRYWKDAVLLISNANDFYYTVNLTAAAGEYAVKTKNKKLKDISYDVDPIIPEAYKYGLFLIQATAAAPDTLTFDIGGGSFSYNQAHTNNLLVTLTALAAQVNLQTGTHGFTASASRLKFNESTGKEMCFFYVSKPFSYTTDTTALAMFYAVGNVSDYQTPIDNDTAHPTPGREHITAHMNNMFHFEYYRDFFETRQYTFPMFMNNGILGGETTEDVRIFNLYDGGAGTYDLTNLGEELAVPFPFLKYVIQKTLEDSAYKMTGPFFEDEEIQNIILESNFSADYTLYDGNEFVGDVFTMEDLVPDSTAGNLLNKLKNTFCVGIFFNSFTKETHFISFKEMLASNERDNWTKYASQSLGIEAVQYDGFFFAFEFDSADRHVSEKLQDISIYNEKDPVQSVSSLPTSGNNTGDIRLILDENMYALVDIDPSPDEWSSYTQNLNDKKILNGAFSINNALQPCFIRHGPYNAHSTLATKQIMGWVALKIRSVLNSVNNQTNIPRILFWRGEDTDGDSNPYPLASYDVYDWAFNRDFNYAVKWEGEYGLISTFWLDFINFWKNTRLVRFKMKPDINLFYDQEIWKRKRIDRNDYFVKELNFEITEKGIESIDAEMYLIKMHPYRTDYYETYDGEEGGGG